MCQGSEPSLFICPAQINTSSCDHSMDAGVICISKLLQRGNRLDTYVATRVESGSGDSDNLGYSDHFFGGSSGSHLQTKLYPDITCSLENSVGIW